MLKIKKLYQGNRVAFGASGLPLGKRSKEEILDLAIIAKESGNKSLIVLFEDELPALSELKAMKFKTRIQNQNKKPPAIEQQKKEWPAKIKSNQVGQQM